MIDVITIDGYSGCLKSICAKALAKRLGIQYLSAGTIYRFIAFQYTCSNSKKNNLSDAINYTTELCKSEISKIKRHFDSIDLYSQRIQECVSDLALCPIVVDSVNSILLEMVRSQKLIIDGRNLGCYLFPDAILKVFVKTDITERIRKLKESNLRKNVNLTDEEYINIQTNMLYRDYNDEHRVYQPLQCPVDAVRLDILNISIDTAVEILTRIYNKRWNKNLL